jgi:alkaline phosphatase
MVKELFAFDEAIKAGIDFQQKHPTDTLIVVTSDHETGGIVLPENLESLNPMLIVKQKASYTVIFEELKKISDPENNFDRALNIVKDYLGFDDFTTAEQADLKAIWNEPETRNNFKKFVSQASKFRDLRCGIKWSTGGHSEAPVITSALGNGQELFEGNYENTEIFEKLKQLILR